MLAFLAPLSVLAVVVLALLLYSGWKTRGLERRFPNIGELIDVGGWKMNSVFLPAGETADLPPVVFIHGASGNLRDPLFAFRRRLQGRAPLLFIDRPGHGYSERGGPENGFPDGQAAAIARVMEERGIASAVIVGHSFGGAIAASFALAFPEMTRGLLFLAPATHPWPGGIDWYYRLARRPLLGWWFTRLVALPVGLSRIEAGMAAVFHPNPVPHDYGRNTGPHLVLRPRSFRYNAVDVANLNAYAARVAPRYGEIEVPTVIVTGDSDDIVAANIHSRGLAHAIRHARLLKLRGLGHKPDYVVTGLAVEAIAHLAGHAVDLAAAMEAAQAELQTHPRERARPREKTPAA